MEEIPWYRGIWSKLLHPRLLPVLRLDVTLVGIVVLASGVASITQGLDYVVRPPESSWALTFLERALPLDFWGWCFILFASCAVVGNSFQFWPLAIFGHGALFISYSSFAFGVGWSVITDWRGYGWQTGILYLGIGMFHALIADACYDTWASEWKEPPPPIELKDTDDGQSDL